MNRTRNVGLSLRKKLLFAAVCTLAAGALAYTGVLVVLSERLYRYVTTSQRAVYGRISRPDPELGFAAVPGARGEEAFPAGPPVPIAIDEHGFRVPTTPAAVAADAEALLALGCSFTFGVACAAEDTFAERVGRARGMRVHNAGGGGYGLVQMLRLARRHVPALRPQLVLAQFSPWLVTRARNDMAPSYFGRLPVPYFAATDGERLDIRGPVFRPKVLDLPIGDYREGGAGRLSFYAHCGFPLYLHDHWCLLAARLAGWPSPELDREKVVRLCYGEIARLCADVNAEAVVVLLGPDEPALVAQLRRIPGLVIVDAEAALRAAVTAEPERGDYWQRYGHWRGAPPQLVDTHPNAFAHERIAAAIRQRLEG